MVKKEKFNPKEIIVLSLEPTPLKNHCAAPCPSPDLNTIKSLGHVVKINP